MPRMRTIKAAVQEILREDPDSAITPYRIRQMILDGTLPCVCAGQRYLVNLDLLLNYLNNPSQIPTQQTDKTGIMRPVGER